MGLIPIALDPEATFALPIPGGPTFQCRYMTMNERGRFDAELRRWSKAAAEAETSDDASAENLARTQLWGLLSKYLKSWDRAEALTLDAMFDCMTRAQFYRLLALCGDEQTLSEDHRKNSVSPGNCSSASSANGAPQVAAAAVFAGGR